MRPLKFLLSLALLPLVLTACGGPKTPEEQVEQIRGKYTVQVNGLLEQTPEPEPEVMAEGEMAEGEMADEGVASSAEGAMAAETEEGAEGEGAEGEGMMEPEMEEGPRTAQILLDLLVVFDGSESLPGLTVDISHADPFEKEKANYRKYIEPGTMLSGEQKQVPVILEVENFETGDAFSAFVRSNVPPEERGEYREFAEYGGS